ncbi:hypothetical protein [Deinococcus maricopensis]|uniref:Uncharacterized protein n=1 Tax=Deinococcus maricopensis (strain DSM 21211 / LMG 22137 / NRRL B-23946 / LB-34) TaxID=709986 RepID=E8U5V9_DEIML|nr:hypothetical protein [Deinococcus maricopensis]ADV66448.1 hypothetical protein Deima_0793 [Deinococcus maricopensis DSM 21211]
MKKLLRAALALMTLTVAVAAVSGTASAYPCSGDNYGPGRC